VIELRGSLDLDDKQQRIAKLEEAVAKPDFWLDAPAAQSILAELTRLRADVNEWHALNYDAVDISELVALADEFGDEDALRGASRRLKELEKRLGQLEFKVLLANPYDRRSAIVELHPGAGGVDSQDWAQMMMRMYTRWAENRGFKVEILDYLAGDEAGIKSVSLLLSGDYAYGYLQAEKGVHRMVRLSPFDASARRHTSFAAVSVIPEIEEDAEINVNIDEVRIDTFRASGAGGQSVNKTDSAVRITHFPTGIVVQCQNERSQLSNKATAMRMLKSKLLERKLAEQLAALQKLRGDMGDNSWGNQIRSYVFHPYNMVKDHRTGWETGNIQAVMDGAL
ncbi:MAG: peptide chain release factor 2, partial [bacterium]|nr:peptide chain release factor 2 [bacterium]